MEFLLASPTPKLWQLVVGAVQDVEADVALLAIVATLKITLRIIFFIFVSHLNALKSLVNVPPPEVEPASVDLDLHQHLLCQPTSLDSSLSVNLSVP